MLKVTFLMHSCFLVELDGSYLLFDYFNGAMQEHYRREIVLPELKPEKWLYVFSSHFHGDHFGLEALRWKQEREAVSYIFSQDIRLGGNFLRRHGYAPEIRDEILFVKPGREYTCRDLDIRTLFSTDAGVAYVVEAEGKRIYHAGDLNWWHWQEDTDEEKQHMERHYKSYLKKLNGAAIDVAFVPYDPKLKEAAIYGISYFLQVTETKWLFPMHFWGRFDLLGRITETLPSGLKTEIMLPKSENEQFVLEQ